MKLNKSINIRVWILLVILFAMTSISYVIDFYRLVYTEPYSPLADLRSWPSYLIVIGILVVLLPEIFYAWFVYRRRNEINALEEKYIMKTPFFITKYWVLTPAVLRPSLFAAFWLLSLVIFSTFFYFFPNRIFIIFGVASLLLSIFAYIIGYVRYRKLMFSKSQL